MMVIEKLSMASSASFFLAKKKQQKGNIVS